MLCSLLHCCCGGRDLRDAALDEASRLRTELRQLRTQHEELLLSSRTAAASAGVSHSELLGELKVKGFELTRLQVCACGSACWLTVWQHDKLGSHYDWLVAQLLVVES